MNIRQCYELHTRDERHKFTESLDEHKSLRTKIREVNRATGVKTWLDCTIGKESSTVPEGIRLFQYTGKEQHLKEADSEIQRLFKNRRLFSDLTPHETKADFVALFWAATEKNVVSLRAALVQLERKGLSSFSNIMTAYYVPLIIKLLALSREDVMNAWFELILYGDSKEAGLEQHIDNVTRTRGMMGPLCGINFVSSRSIDMLPSLQDGTQLRIYTAPGDLLVMDSEARIHWSHSVPYGCTKSKRYLAVIRPATSGACFGVLDPKSRFGPPIYRAPPCLRAKAEFVVPRLSFCDEERQYITWASDAYRRNAYVAYLKPVQIWDLFAGIGGDAVQFLSLLPGSQVQAVQIPTEQGRMERLRKNTSPFKSRCTVHACSAADFLASQQEGGRCDFLYLDPPWMEGGLHLPPVRLRENLQAEVFGLIESIAITTICLKTKFPWHALNLPFELSRTIQAGDVGKRAKYLFHFFNRKQETPTVFTLKIKLKNPAILAAILQAASLPGMDANEKLLATLEEIIRRIKKKKPMDT